MWRDPDKTTGGRTDGCGFTVLVLLAMAVGIPSGIINLFT